MPNSTKRGDKTQDDSLNTCSYDAHRILGRDGEGVDFSPQWRRSMTVCIAAIAAKSKAIVLTSDKAITVGSRAIHLQSDSSVRKILPIGNSGWRSLIAGDASFAQKVIRHARASFPKTRKTNESFASMMELMKKSYQEVRKQVMDDQVLKPLLLNEELLVARKNTYLPLPDVFVKIAVDGITKYDAGTSMLICGFGPDGIPHIFTISEPGTVTIHDLSGYWAIGIGDFNAIERLLWAEVSKKNDLDLMLYQVFDAKANAEIVQGVGYDWDAEVMVNGKKSQRVRSDIKKLVAKVFEENTGSPFLKKQFPARWKRKLETYASELLRGKNIKRSVSRRSEGQQ